MLKSALTKCNKYFDPNLRDIKYLRSCRIFDPLNHTNSFGDFTNYYGDLLPARLNEIQ